MVLWWKKNIPVIAPILPPIAEKNSNVNSGILYLCFIANSLSSPIMINSNIFIIPKEYWNNGTALFSLVNDDGAQVEFYRTGDVLVKYNAGADSNIYKFTYNEVNGTIKQEAVKISGGDSKLIRNVKANVSAGAISSGDTVLKDTTFTEFVEKLLIK